MKTSEFWVNFVNSEWIVSKKVNFTTRKMGSKERLASRLQSIVKKSVRGMLEIKLKVTINHRQRLKKLISGFRTAHKTSRKNFYPKIPKIFPIFSFLSQNNFWKITKKESFYFLSNFKIIAHNVLLYYYLKENFSFVADQSMFNKVKYFISPFSLKLIN